MPTPSRAARRAIHLRRLKMPRLPPLTTTVIINSLICIIRSSIRSSCRTCPPRSSVPSCPTCPKTLPPIPAATIFEKHFRGSAAHRCLVQLEEERQDAIKAKSGSFISDDRASKRQKLEDQDENVNDEEEEKKPVTKESKMGFDIDGHQWKTAFRIVHSAVHEVKTGGNQNEGGLPPAMLRTGNLTKAELDKLQVDLKSDLRGEQVHRAEEIMKNDDGFGEDRWHNFDVAKLGVKTQRMLQDFVARVSQTRTIFNHLRLWRVGP